MGSGSERMIEIQEERHNRRLAEKLGISYDELLELDYQINTDESDDGLIYNHILEFNENAPDAILAKIQGLEDGKQVWFSQGTLFDDYDEDKDEVKP